MAVRPATWESEARGLPVWGQSKHIVRSCVKRQKKLNAFLICFKVEDVACMRFWVLSPNNGNVQTNKETSSGL